MVIDEKHTREFLTKLLKINSVVEIRGITQTKGRRTNRSGYFTDVNKAIECLKNTYDYDTGAIYFVMNKIANPKDVMAKEQANKFIPSNSTTKDDMIESYQWLYVDIDSIRSAGISATEEEIKQAGLVARKVYNYMQDKGFSKPLVALSGNGYHLLYRTNLMISNKSNYKLSEEYLLVKKVLEVLDIYFSNDKAKIDVVNCNPSRICKLYGTYSKKGTSTLERPHRLSHVFDYGDINITNDVKLLRSIANEVPEAKKVDNKAQQFNKEFDVKEFFNKHNIRVVNETSINGGTKYELEECPFNSDHNKDHPAVFDFDNGGQEFKCFHNSCSTNHWKEFRLFYEPNAYEYKQLVSNATMQQTNKFSVADIFKGTSKAIDKNSDVLLKPSEAFTKNKKTNEFIPTGFKELDKWLGGGFQKTYLTVLGGLSGGGKSTLLNQIVINMVSGTNAKVVYYSGELTAGKLLWWLIQNIGGDYLKDLGNFKYSLDEEVQNAIIKWLDNKIYIYNNDVGQDFDILCKAIAEGIEKYKVDVIVVDNLTVIDKKSLTGSNNTFQIQSEIVNGLKEIAKRCNVHIVLVVHFRKTSNLPRVEDISGSGDIRNLADNVLILHRNDEEFKRKVENEYGKNNSFVPTFSQNADMYLEIAKERENGNIGHLVPLFFQKSTKRVLNNLTEKKNFEWEEEFLDLPF